MRIQKKGATVNAATIKPMPAATSRARGCSPGATSALMKKRPKATVAGVNHDVSHIQNRSLMRTV